MTVHAPHFVLFSESTADQAAEPPQGVAAESAATTALPYWHFVLRTDQGSVALDARGEEESGASPERLALLAVVRGLEALPEPSRVTLVTTSGWIRRGLRFGLDNWRDQHWRWECFGRMTPIKNADLWQRVDRALQFHEVECQTIRVDRPSDDLSCPVPPAMLRTRIERVAVPRPPHFPLPPAGRRAEVGLWRRLLQRLCIWCGPWSWRSPAVIAAP